MKKKITSILALVLMICLIGTLFAGCGSSSDDEEEEAEEETVEETEAEEEEEVEEAEEEEVEEEEEEEAEEASSEITMPLSEEVIEFTWWNAMNPNLVQYIEDMNDILVYQEMEEISNVHIDWVTVSASVESEQFNIMIASEEYTDICGSSMSAYSGGNEAALADDIIIDLTDLLPTYAPDYWALITEDEANYKLLSTSENLIISFDVVYTENIDADFGPQIRQDLLDELGMDLPQTYDDMYEFLTACKTELGMDGAFLLPQQSAVNLNFISAGFGVAAFANNGMGSISLPFYQVDGEIKFGPLEDGFTDYVSLMNQWYSEGLINPDYVSLGNGWNPDEDTVLNGEAAVWFDDRGNLDTYNSSNTVDGFYAVGTYDLVQEVGDQLHFASETTNVSQNSIYILSVCEYPEIACSYFNYRYTEEGELLNNWGVEGITYEIGDDGNPHYTDIIVNNEEYNAEYALQVYCLWRAPMLTDSTKFADIYSEEIIEASEIWSSNRDGDYYISDGVSMASEDADEYNLLVADIETYYSEMLPKFITGEVSIDDEYDNFVATLEDLGIDRCIELWQTALDAYNAK